MAAPLGFKTFATGDVLTAADTNGYLMQGVWAFASAAARTAAVTSPQEGNISYLKDTDVIQYYSGSAWVTVGGASGLTYITSQTASNVATLTFDDVFTSTYLNYLITFTGVRSTSSAPTADLYFQWRYSGTTDTAGYKYGITGVNSAGTVVTVGATAQSQAILSRNLGDSTYKIGGQMFVRGVGTTAEMPMATGQTIDTYGEELLNVEHYNGTARTYTGFIISTSSGNINGTFTVYGLAKS
jgi:hypothetical protein